MDTDRTIEAMGGGELPPTFDGPGICEALSDLFAPRLLFHRIPRVLNELVHVALGNCDLDFPARDKRFDEATWRDNPLYHRLGQFYVVWSQWLESLADNPELDPERQFRARLLARALTSALAPTNTLPGNPTAVKRAFDTGGMSLLRGARNFAGDVLTNSGMPAQVDNRPFAVGENLACTPGSVIYREDIFELLQYSASTVDVHRRPLLMVPPQINKYYDLDLAPGRSLVEYTVGQGVQYFTISWRNARREHGGWSLDDYVAAVLRAVDVVLEVTGTDDLNLLGVCAGGLTSALALGYLAVTGRHLIHSVSLMTTMIDSGRVNMLRSMATPALLGKMANDAQRGVVYSRRSVARSFAWMRPNDLIFNFLVNDWLLGEKPPASDILAWNVDMANLASAFDHDMLKVYAGNLAATPRQLSVLNTPIDLTEVDCDAFILAGSTDHITPWQTCFMTSQVTAGRSEFILALTGHVLALVNPPGQARARHRAGPVPRDLTPDEWLARSTEHQGSWWPRWTKWLTARSGATTPAPSRLGALRYPAIEPAPGRYLRET
jgi:poly[(R)-3-hydroxyalkanoate] polymerase subunit PhaC